MNEQHVGDVEGGQRPLLLTCSSWPLHQSCLRGVVVDACVVTSPSTVTITAGSHPDGRVGRGLLPKTQDGSSSNAASTPPQLADYCSRASSIHAPSLEVHGVTGVLVLDFWWRARIHPAPPQTPPQPTSPKKWCPPRRRRPSSTRQHVNDTAGKRPQTPSRLD